MAKDYKVINLHSDELGKKPLGENVECGKR